MPKRCMQRAKTDPVDARLILDYTQRMPFQPWQPPDESVRQLEALTRRIGQLKRDLIAERCRLQAEGYRARADRPASPAISKSTSATCSAVSTA